jgi:hypothetical protein
MSDRYLANPLLGTNIKIAFDIVTFFAESPTGFAARHLCCSAFFGGKSDAARSSHDVRQSEPEMHASIL